MWLTRLALRNPVLILMLSLMMIVLGVVSVTRLSVDLFPDITIPMIRVATFYSGAGPGRSFIPNEELIAKTQRRRRSFLIGRARASTAARVRDTDSFRTKN